MSSLIILTVITSFVNLLFYEIHTNSHLNLDYVLTATTSFLKLPWLPMMVLHGWHIDWCFVLNVIYIYSLHYRDTHLVLYCIESVYRSIISVYVITKRLITYKALFLWWCQHHLWRETGLRFVCNQTCKPWRLWKQINWLNIGHTCDPSLLSSITSMVKIHWELRSMPSLYLTYKLTTSTCYSLGWINYSVQFKEKRWSKQTLSMFLIQYKWKDV